MTLSDAEIKRLAQEAKALEESATGDKAIANLKEALRCYDRIIADMPDHPFYLYQRAEVKRILDTQGDYQLDSAIDDISRAIDLEPDNANYYRIRALYCWRRMEGQQAEKQVLSPEEADQIVQDLRLSIRKDPSQSTTWLDLLAFETLLQDWDDAISIFGQCNPYVLSKKDRVIRSYFGCLALTFAGDPIEKEDIAPLQERDGRFTHMPMAVNQSRYLISKYIEHEGGAKKKNLKDVVELLADHIDSWFSKGCILETVNVEKALKAYENAIREEPKDVLSYYNCANIYLDKRNFDRAIDYYDKAIELCPEYAVAYDNRGLAYQRKGRFDKAIDNRRKAIEINPQFADAHYNLGYCYYHERNFKKAIESLGKTIKLNPKDGEAHFYRASAYAMKKHWWKNNKEKVFKDLKKAIELDSHLRWRATLNPSFDTYKDDLEFKKIVDST